MRPTVIYIEKDKTIDISKDRLEELLKEAYEQGYADGAAHSAITWTTDRNIHYTKENKPWWYDQAMCDANSSGSISTTTLS